MRQFKLRADLAAGLTHRLQQLDPDKVAQTLGGKPSAAVRENYKVARKIEEQNHAYMSATKDVADRQRAYFAERKKKYDADRKGKSEEEKAKLLSKFREDYEEKFAEIAGESKARHDEVIDFEIGNDSFDKVLSPLFELTANTWGDAEGNNAQKYFLEVADALEGIEPENV